MSHHSKRENMTFQKTRFMKTHFIKQLSQGNDSSSLVNAKCVFLCEMCFLCFVHEGHRSYPCLPEYLKWAMYEAQHEANTHGIFSTVLSCSGTTIVLRLYSLPEGHWYWLPHSLSHCLCLSCDHFVTSCDVVPDNTHEQFAVKKPVSHSFSVYV